MNYIYNTCVQEAFNYTDKDAYISDLALSSIWGDEVEDVPEEKIARLGEIYDAVNRTLKDIITEAGMSQKELSERFCIPYRTVQNWCGSVNRCPVYTKLMIQEILGMYSVKNMEEFFKAENE